ncbi:hypothetical protein [Deefgea piscis]|uniref:hypothetical protein n=1 Tax=Deefgea piscis TaxID=2739061 RepID=UPI001C801F32|nr:hypothetical protein [Deefgea piscis]QZA80362.1 hypothetical protein K4H25_12580 [Deefgea piscis]
MPTYQFFKRNIEAKSEIRYLPTDQDQFFANKELLLAQGFEVDGYIIYAANENDAISVFNCDIPYAQIEVYNPNAANDLSHLFEVVIKWISSLASKFKK